MPQVARMKVSKLTATRMAEFEGGRGQDGKYHPYRDSGGTWTIGIGHTEGVTSNTKPLTAKQASDLFAHDLDHAYIPALRAQLKAYGIKELSQSRFDSLVDMVFNCGVGILSPVHTIGQALKRHQWKKVSQSFDLYVHDRRGARLAGLIRRRNFDQALWDENTNDVASTKTK